MTLKLSDLIHHLKFQFVIISKQFFLILFCSGEEGLRPQAPVKPQRNRKAMSCDAGTCSVVSLSAQQVVTLHAVHL